MNSISQNFKKMLKNKINILITPILYKTVDSLVDNIFLNPTNITYSSMFLNIQSSVRELIKSVIISTFKEIDNSYKNSIERKTEYYVNKSNVPRTIDTIVGTISFSRTYYKHKHSKKCLFYIDKIFDLPKYDHFDTLVKSIAIDKAVHTSQAQSARDTSAYINDLNYYFNYNNINNISRQTIYNWIKEWNVPNVVPKASETPETLYVMADEKFIGAQNIDENIMIKSFVTFEDIKEVSKGRRALVNRTTFSHYGQGAWEAFMDFIAKKYDFSKIKNISLLSDGGKWIKSGLSELKLDVNNNVKFYLCEFHFKQAIHHITTDKEERKKLLNIFTNNPKKEFKKTVEQIITDTPKRSEIITKKLDYILNNYTAIKNMLSLNIGSSMESHISHLIASFFSARPKGFSTERIEKYLKLNDYKNNGINISQLYMQSYNNKEVIQINEDEINYSIFENPQTSNIPVLARGQVTELYSTLYSLAH